MKSKRYICLFICANFYTIVFGQVDTSKYEINNGNFHYQIEVFRLYDSVLYQKRKLMEMEYNYAFTNNGANTVGILRIGDSVILNKCFHADSVVFSLDSLFDMVLINPLNTYYQGFVPVVADTLKYRGLKCVRYLNSNFKTTNKKIRISYFYKRVPIRITYQLYSKFQITIMAIND